MPRRTRAQLAAVDTEGRDGSTGQFREGNRGARAIVVLPGFDVATAAPWVRPHVENAQRRYRGALQSGLFKRTGTRLHGLLRAAVLADATHDALTAHALTLAVSEAREVLTEARSAAREARTAWAKLFATVGVTYGGKATDDPLGALARELGGDADAD